MNKIAIGVSAALALAATTASAHHSRANFDLDKTVEYQGTVTRYAWTNPHTGIYVDAKTADGKTIALKIEGNSVATMIRRGWSKDSLKPGDRVVVKGNPDRTHPDFLYFNSIEKAGGAQVGSGFRQASAASVGSKDFTGVWRPIFDMGGGAGARPAAPGGAGGAKAASPAAGASAGAKASAGSGGGAAAAGRAVLLGSPQPSHYAVTPKGAASYAKFSGKDDPRNDCVPESLPAAIQTAPYEFQIERHENGDYEIVNENYAARRVIHMNQKAPPAGTKRDHDGYSIGHMEGNVLVVDTTLFSPQPWGNDAGLDSGEQKHLVERYSLENDGRSLVITYTQTDPEYLAKPVTQTLRWQLEAENKLVAEWANCSPEAGRRHLVEGTNVGGGGK